MIIQNKKVVSIHFTLKTDDGQILETTAGQKPLSYLQGYGNVLKGLEEGLLGKKVGDKVDLKIPPENAYGIKDELLLQAVPITDFKGLGEVKEGIRIEVETNQGPKPAVITKINTDTVIIDLNHPLANKTLHFDVEITKIRDAKEDEIAHGHVHESKH